MKRTLSRDSEGAYRQKYSYIIGADEAGRGPLAGPVVCAAVYVSDNVHVDGVMDSKQMTENERELSFEALTHNSHVIWASSIVSHTEIDKMNILQASLFGMKSSILKVLEQMKLKDKEGLKCHALVDGNKIPSEMPVTTSCVVKGDSNVFSIAAASIIAKVTRDRIMRELSVKYPVYNFSQHKGYPTAEHRMLLHIHGPCEVHRLSYGPVKQAAIRFGIIAVEQQEPSPQLPKKRNRDSKEGSTTKRSVNTNSDKRRRRREKLVARSPEEKGLRRSARLASTCKE